MTETESSKSRNPLGCLGPAVGIAGLVATFALGPIDLGRSVYNQIIGDTPVLKQELLNYVKRNYRPIPILDFDEHTNRPIPILDFDENNSRVAEEIGYK